MNNKSKNENNLQIKITNTELVEYIKTKSIVLKVFLILLICFAICLVSSIIVIHLNFKNKQTISKERKE